jgi:peptidyl-prolyl cis-trans isomerase C
MRARVAPSLGLAFVLALGACNDKALEASGNPDAGKKIGGSLTTEQAQKVLAKVGTHTITLGDFVAGVEHMDQFDRLRYQSPERRRELLAEMINMQLLADEAKEKGYDKDPKVAQELRAVLRDAMLAEAHKDAPTQSEIPASDVRDYFDKHKDMFKDPERRRLSVIVLSDPVSAAAALEAAKKTTTATQWGEVVRARSVDPTAKSNVPIDLVGDYGIVSAKAEGPTEANAKAPPEVRAALFELENVGDIYDKVVAASDHKFYVVRFTQKFDARDRPFNEAERSIRVKLVQEKVREKEDALLAQLKTEFPVQIDEKVLATVRVDLSDAGGPLAPVDAGQAPHTP